MRRTLSVIAALGGISMTFSGTAALAGACGGYGLPSCPVFIVPPPPPPIEVQCNHYIRNGCPTEVRVRKAKHYDNDPMIVTQKNPLDHLRRVKFSGTPHVNILRVHGQMPSATLSDHPTSFGGGCNPSSTGYCTQADAHPQMLPTVPGASHGGGQHTAAQQHGHSGHQGMAPQSVMPQKMAPKPMSAMPMANMNAKKPYIAPPAPLGRTQIQQPRQYGSMAVTPPMRQPMTQPHMQGQQHYSGQMNTGGQVPMRRGSPY